MPESDSTAFFFEFDETAIVSPGFQRLHITIIQSRWLAGGWASKAKEEASMLNVQLLGTPSFRILDRPAGGELGKAGRLLGSFLFTFANQPFRRDHLQDLFWGDLSVERGRAALNTAIWRLRKLLSAPPSSHIGCLSVGARHHRGSCSQTAAFPARISCQWRRSPAHIIRQYARHHRRVLANGRPCSH
jgi:hypothetical protein